MITHADFASPRRPVSRLTASLAPSLALGLTLALAAGCSSNKNHRLTVGDSIPLASFPPEVVELELDPDGNPLPPAPPADDRPTALGLDRSNFGPIIYRVPIDGTRHEFHGFGRVAFTDETARQRGEFPTATSALETGGNVSTRQQIAEVLVQPVVAAGGVVTNLLVSTSGAHTSPAPFYERSPVPTDPMRAGVIHTPATATTGVMTPSETPTDDSGSTDKAETPNESTR